MQALKKLIITDKNFYSNPKGRLSRNQFLMNWFFPVFALQIVLMFVMQIVPMIWPLVSLVGFAVIILGVCPNIRRLHDQNKTGWYQLCLYVPVIGSMFLPQIVSTLLALVALYGLFLLVFVKGDEGENQYGPVPLQMALGLPK